MLTNSILIVFITALASVASAYIRFSCANSLVEERADPIVAPGKVSGHVHKIAGGGNFGFNVDYEQLRASKCSSCQITQDLSNYWTPKLYFRAEDGTFASVPTVGDGLDEQNGGMTVYYQQRGPKTSRLKAFPPGFRMLAGNAMQRNYTGSLAADAISFACLGSGRSETHGLPDYSCPSGLRAQVYFPSCWDGVNLDSPDHKRHMSYPASAHYDNGPCPASHPVRLVSLFFEVLYNTDIFKDRWQGDKQPFVFANGDSTGYGFHGDFINGWDVDALQQIIDTCDDDSKFGSIDKTVCPVIDQFTRSEMKKCRIPTSIGEQVYGNLTALPGCNPVTGGPGSVVPGSDCPLQAPTAVRVASFYLPERYFTDVTRSRGWHYLGCGSDSAGSRALSGPNTLYMNVGSAMTVEWCIDWCGSKGYGLAGLEYSTQCYCDNTIPKINAPRDGIAGNCRMKCAGDAEQYCGGALSLSLYQKCESGPCSNYAHSAVGNLTGL